MAQYVARFIKNFSATVEPLRILTRKDTPWRWSHKEEDAFEKLKHSMAN